MLKYLVASALFTGAMAGPGYGAEPARMTHCASWRLHAADAAMTGTAEYPIGEAERMRGFQNRFDLDPDASMIFEMDGRRDAAIWMKDTPAPLDILFFDAEGFLVHVAHGRPFSEETLHAPGWPPISYVMELPQGSLSRSGIDAGVARLDVATPARCRPSIQGDHE